MSAEWCAARRVLCVRLDNLGDVLMSTPAMHALQVQRPDRELTLLCSRASRVLLPHLPDVEACIGYDAPWVRHGDDAGTAHDEALLRVLCEARFDAAVIFAVYSQSALPAALMCRLAGIPLRLAHSRENAYGLLTHGIRDPEPQTKLRHEVQRQLDLVAAVGAWPRNTRLRLQVHEPERRQLRARLAMHGIDADAPWLLLHPGATAESRRWPREHYAQAADALHAELGWPLVFSGSASEAALIGEVRAAMRAPSLSLAGVLGFGECAAAIEAATLLIANNSGPVHIAAACGTPVVVPYALTNPQHQPWRVPQRVLTQPVDCQWCYASRCLSGHHRCLRDIAPSRLVSAALALLEQTRPLRRTCAPIPSALTEPAS